MNSRMNQDETSIQCAGTRQLVALRTPDDVDWHDRPFFPLYKYSSDA